MKYDISKSTAPKMPALGKGTEYVKILLSQVSKEMHEPLVPMLFLVLGAHVSGSEFQYPDLSWKELCGMMGNLVADSGCIKASLGLPPPFGRAGVGMSFHRTASPLTAQPNAEKVVPLHRNEKGSLASDFG